MVMKRSMAFLIVVLFILPLLIVYTTTKSANAANIVYKSGHISISEIWTAENLYVIQDNLTVDQGVALTIEPGTVVKFVENKLLGVYGILRIGMVGGAYYSNYLPITL